MSFYHKACRLCNVLDLRETKRTIFVMTLRVTGRRTEPEGKPVLTASFHCTQAEP